MHRCVNKAYSPFDRLRRAHAVVQNARHGVLPGRPPAHQVSLKNVPGSLLQPSSNTRTADIHGVVFRSPGSVVWLENLAVFTTRAVLSGKFRAVCYSSGWKKGDQRHSAGNKRHRLRLRSGKRPGARHEPRDFRSVTRGYAADFRKSWCPG